MELFTSVVLALTAIAMGVALIVLHLPVANLKRDVEVTGGKIRNGFSNP